MPLWLSKPVYLLIPYFYAVAGICFLLAAAYLDYWYWPLVAGGLGTGCLAGAAFVWWQRNRRPGGGARSGI